MDKKKKKKERERKKKEEATISFFLTQTSDQFEFLKLYKIYYEGRQR